jgi:hypothetical protein
MISSSPFRHLTATFSKRVVGFLTAVGSSLALAQAVPVIGASGDTDGSKHAYRGTSVSYGHSATALTFAPGGDPFMPKGSPYYYNPTEVHRLGLMPEWHFIDEFFVRGRFFLSQELTLSDETNVPYEVELSDLWLDAVYAGYKEKNTGLRFAGDLRFTFPTSKNSRMQSRIMTVGPGLNVSRSFKVLGGLTLVYATRFTFRFNRFATSQNAGPRIINCDPRFCQDLVSTGRRNSTFDVLHGPTVVFNPHEKVSIAATFLMQRAFLPELASLPAEFQNIPELQNDGPNTRDAVAFSVGVTYQPWDLVGLTLGAFTFSSQLRADSTYEFPLFNRNTVVSLDATFDLEAAISAVTPKEHK